LSADNINTSTLIIGVGNELRRDDGAGIAVAQQLRNNADLPAQIDIITHHGEGLGLLEAWQGYQRVIIIDATRSGAAAGSVCCFDVLSRELPEHFFNYSSHLFGLAEAIRLARVLDRLPDELMVYGIEGAEFAYGEGLTPVVAAGVVDVTRQLFLQI
jgi:hydrogenase maturation protease